ncbi:MAG: stage II sporulation protein M [Candidatus Aenigmarchaeota archaeon]
MLESLVNFKEINERPYMMAIWAFIICCIAVLISSQVPLSVPGTNSGFIVVLFVIIPSVYFITVFLKKEEELEEGAIARHEHTSFWGRHEKDILILLFYFFGLTIAFAVWSFFLPQNFFNAQITKINEIQGMATSLTGQATGAAAGPAAFNKILFNNLQVMFFSFIFSFIFGAGAIFIIAWNASVLGVYIGQLSKYVWHIPIVSLSFLPHGIPEIAGYLAAGLAGGLMSAAIIRKNTSKTLQIVSFDVAKILVVGVLLIVLGAGIESFVG